MNDVKFVSMGLPAAHSALENGSADCALLAGPLAYNAEKEGLNVVTTGDGLVSGLTVTAVSGKFYKDHKDLVDTFLAVQKETLDFMKKNPDEALSLTAKATDLSPKPVKEITLQKTSAHDHLKPRNPEKDPGLPGTIRHDGEESRCGRAVRSKR